MDTNKAPRDERADSQIGDDSRDEGHELSAAAAALLVDERVDEQGDASFPASDPPSWWSGP